MIPVKSWSTPEEVLHDFRNNRPLACPLEG